jgi:sulfhydrogenase subunit beta (sulfur reductase)
MSLRTMPKSALTEWIEHLTAGYRLIGPRPVNGQFSFDEVHSASEIDLGYPTSVLPPKKALAPQREELVRFDRQKNTAKAYFDERPTVIFGMHTCDLHAISLLDQAFGRGMPDQNYAARRENTTIVSIECLTPCTEHAFCKDMGTLSVTENFDLHLTDLGDVYAIDIGSPKGAALLEGVGHVQEPSEQEYRRLSRVMNNKWSRFPYRLEVDITELPSLLTISYKSSLWDDLGKQCLACGMCTLVCPTCYCFDVVDEIDLSLNSGARYRVWDSCQLNQFATVAGGHNFRASRGARQRHRFMRKYKYQSLAPGLLGCVGCGRCGSTCLVGITPVGVLNKLSQRRVGLAQGRQEVVNQ